MRVPRVDADGNEIGGVPTVLRDAPLGTYPGWNITPSGFHAGQVCNYVGGMIPFAVTPADRIPGDPRLSLCPRLVDGQFYRHALDAWRRRFGKRNRDSHDLHPRRRQRAKSRSHCSGATYGILGPCEADVFRTPIAPTTTFTFHWAYTTADSGGPPGDIFGMLINGNRIQLSDPGGPISQSGNVTVSAATSIGWFVNCTDCIEGAATAAITNFAAVPEPASLGLLGLGLASLCGMRRRVA